MSIHTYASYAAAEPSSRSLLARHPLAAYFALAYGLSWLILVPAAFGLISDSAGGLLSWLAPFGPALAAFIVTARTGGRAGVRQLLRRLVQWRVGLGWYLLILAGIPLLELLGAFALLGAVPLDDLGRIWPLVFTRYLPYVLYVFIVTSLGEEPGWRGFALPRLQERQGPLLGTAALGALWAAWHLPNLLFGRWTIASSALFLVGIAASAFLYTWVYNRTGGSVLLAMLLHAAQNAATGLPRRLVAGLDAASDAPLYGALAVAFVATALLLVAATRGRLGYRPEGAASPGAP